MVMKKCPWCSGKHRSQSRADRCGRKKVPQTWAKNKVG